LKFSNGNVVIRMFAKHCLQVMYCLTLC